jgi:hypothetical protein
MSEKEEEDVSDKEEECVTDETPTPRELYPDAFEFDVEHLEPLEQPHASSRAQLWSELKTEDTAPKRGDLGVTTKIGLLRFRVRKDGKEWVRLKTPALIRELQKEKSSAPQV